MATGLTCLVCGGTYTADQRRRHEQTTKHVNAQIGRAMKGQAEAKKESTVRSPMDTRPAPDPAKVEAHVAALQANGESGLVTSAVETAKGKGATYLSPKPKPTAAKALKVDTGRAKPGASVSDLVVTGDPVEFWTRRVKIWANDVKWAEAPAQAGNKDRIAARKARLAEGEAALAAAVAAKVVEAAE